MIDREELEPTGQRSMTCGIMLLFTFGAAGPIAWYLLNTDATFLRALGVLLLPASFAAWSYSTIVALHAIDLHFWSIRSTWVAVCGTLVALALFMINGLTALATPDKAKAALSPTLTMASLIVVVCAALACAWINWRRTRSVAIAASVTVLQTVLGVCVIGVVIALMRRRDDDVKKADF